MAKKFFAPFRLLINALSIAAGIGLLIFPPTLLSTEANKAAALSIVVLSLWITSIIPEYLTALFFFLVAMLLSISEPGVIFSGFQSTAFWLVFGGLVLGSGITDTGLGSRLAFKVVFFLKDRYVWLITGAVVMGVLFSFLIPSALGRTVLLAPIALSIARHFGFPDGSNGRTGIVLALVMGTVLPACAILPANVVNMVLVGMSETQFEISLLYGEYLLLHFPILGVLKALTIVGLILWIYPDKPRQIKTAALSDSKPLSRNELIVSIVTAALLILWMSDFIHHVSPAWVALGGALVLLLPNTRIVNTRQFNQNINFGSLFFLAGILGFGGIVSHTGLGDTLAGKLIDSLPLAEGRPFTNYMLLALASMFTGIVATVPSVPAVMTPIADNLSQVTGLPLKTVLMTQVLGFSTIVLPFHAPAILIGIQLSGIKIMSAVIFCSILAVVTVLVLLPIDYLWWHILGWI